MNGTGDVIAATALAVIRPCRADDLEAVVALLAADILGSGREAAADIGAYREAFAEIDADPRNTVYVAVEEDRIVGCYQLTIIPNLTFAGGRRALIEGVRIAAGCRGSGLGQQMIRHAIERARAAGCRMVQLTSNKQRADALRFYERLGFQASHVGFKLYL